MNKELIWGVPTQRTKKEEKFSTPVVTMSALEAKGAGRKFSFNKAAQEALGLEEGESYVSFGFSDDKIFVISDQKETPNGVQITKQFSLSNKRLYEYIAKIKALNTNTENHLHLSAVAGEPYYEVTSIESEMVLEVSQDDSSMETDLVEEEEVRNAPGAVFAIEEEEEVGSEDSQVDDWA
jgi:hypothetical protein